MRKTLAVAFLIAQVSLSCAQTLDATFHSPIPFRKANVSRMKLQPDGKMLMGGEINFYEQIAVNHLVRLLPDGTRDNTFNFSGGINYQVQFIELQTNGNIVVSNKESIQILSSTGSLLNTISRPSTTTYITAIAVQSDNKILVATYTLSGVTSLVRFSPDGVSDLSFKQDISVNQSITDIEFQNGKILIAGYFSSVNGVTKNDIARLELDGNLDVTFDTGSGTSDGIGSISVQADGKILPGNAYINEFNGQQYHGMVRLNSDGSVDTGFTLPIYLHGGTSTIKFNGTKIVFAAYYNSAERLFQLNSDGSLDPSFTEILLAAFGPSYEITSDGIVVANNNGSGNPYGIAKHTLSGIKMAGYAPELSRYGKISQVDFTQDNKLIVGGDFIKIDGVITNHVARLLNNGQVDPSFIVSVNNEEVFELKVVGNNQVLVSSSNDMFKVDTQGNVTSDFNFDHFKELYQVGRFYVQPDQRIVALGPNNIYRLKADGTEDATFNIGSGSGGSNSTIFDMDVQADGKIIYGATFDSFNNTPVNRLVRLNNDATIDASFNIGTGPNGDVSKVAVVNNGEIIVAGFFTSFNGTTAIQRMVKLAKNGALDVDFTNNLPSGIPWFINAIKPFWNKIIVADNSYYVRVLENDGKLFNDFQIPQEILGFGRIDNVTTHGTNQLFIGGLIQLLNQQEPIFLTKLVYEPRPVITQVNVPHAKEGTPFQINLSQITATDAWQVFPQGFSLSLKPGSHYTIQGSTITPEKDYKGPLTITLTVSNANAESLPYSFGVEVDAVNRTPVITGITAFQMTEDVPHEVKLTDLYVTDEDSTYPNNFTLQIDNGLHYTVAGAVITPEKNFYGTIAISLMVNDGVNASASFIYNLEIAAVNDPPVIVSVKSNLTSVAGTALNFQFADLTVIDPDNTFPAGFTFSFQPGNGYTIVNNQLIPNESIQGTITASIIVNDGAVNSAPFSFTVLVIPAVNRTPVITGIKAFQMTEDVPHEIKLTDLYVTDEDSTYPNNFTLQIGNGLHYTVNGAVVTPEKDFHGTIAISLIVNDGVNSSASFIYSLEIAAVNDPPVIVSVKSNLTSVAGIALDFEIDDITVIDPDNIFPAGFTFYFQPGNGYTIVNNQLIPNESVQGTITASIIVNDGVVNSVPFSFTVLVIPVTSVEVGETNDLTAYPNPAVDRFTVSVPLSYRPVSLQLRTITGAIMLRTKITFESNSVDIDQLPQGIYFLELQDEQGKVTKSKFVKR
jgi:uncharacterized delta-60 repeat protein